MTRQLMFTTEGQRPQVHAGLWVGLLLGLMCILIATGPLLKSLTFDEPRFLGLGWYLAQHHRWDIEDALAHPPLTYSSVQSVCSPSSTFRSPSGPFESSVRRGQAIISLYPNDLVIRLARGPIILLSVLLGIDVYRWTKDMFGHRAGLLAVAVYTFNPTILALSAVINADIAVTTFGFIALYYWWRFLRTRSWRTFGWAGLNLGLALLSKYSALTILPVMGLLAILPLAVDFVRRRSGFGSVGRTGATATDAGTPDGTAQSAYNIDAASAGLRAAGFGKPQFTFRETAAAVCLVTILGLFVVWIGYGLEWGFASSAAKRPHATLDRLFPQDGPARRISYSLAENTPVPMPSFVKGASLLLSVSNTWHELFRGAPISFLGGKYSANGFRHYYLVAFLIKTPLGALGLLLLAALLFRRLRGPDWFDEASLLVPALFCFVYFSVSSPIQIGLRYVLPAFPFLFVFAGRVGAADRAVWRGCIVFLTVALAVANAASALRTQPDQLAYFNELIGGSGNGYRWLVDSNLDWGQDLGGLKRYMDEHGIAKVKLSYFGTAEPEYYGIDYDYLPSSMVELGWAYLARASRTDRPSLPTTGTIAISATELQAAYFSDKNIYSWLKSRTPVAKIGHSIFIYQVD